MARAHFVKKARKDYPDANIKAGESYYWWKFPYGSKRFSKTQPKNSQLTQSEYYGRLYDLEDQIQELVAGDGLESDVESIISELREIAEECEEKRSNMPEQLQDTGSGEQLQQRVDDCNETADELENLDYSEPDEDATEEEKEEHWENLLNEVQGVSFNYN